jgi:hypothetical protein
LFLCIIVKLGTEIHNKSNKSYKLLKQTTTSPSKMAATPKRYSNH